MFSSRRKELDLAKAELFRLRKEQGRNKMLEKENSDLEGAALDFDRKASGLHIYIFLSG